MPLRGLENGSDPAREGGKQRGPSLPPRAVKERWPFLSSFRVALLFALAMPARSQPSAPWLPTGSKIRASILNISRAAFYGFSSRTVIQGIPLSTPCSPKGRNPSARGRYKVHCEA
jgi:hypothetical protein